jgi:hypothetical protein
MADFYPGDRVNIIPMSCEGLVTGDDGHGFYWVLLDDGRRGGGPGGTFGVSPNALALIARQPAWRGGDRAYHTQLGPVTILGPAQCYPGMYEVRGDEGGAVCYAQQSHLSPMPNAVFPDPGSRAIHQRLGLVTIVGESQANPGCYFVSQGNGKDILAGLGDLSPAGGPMMKVERERFRAVAQAVREGQNKQLVTNWKAAGERLGLPAEPRPAEPERRSRFRDIDVS